MSNLDPTSSPGESAKAQTAPFHAQSAVLASYAHQSDPRADPVALRVVLDVLHKNKELRRHFFELRPHVAWLDVLWEEGFFQTPPPIETLGDSSGWFRFWDVQQFLIANALDRPHYVLGHVEHLDAIKADSLFLDAALRALAAIVPQHPAEIYTVLPVVLGWIENPSLTTPLASSTLELLDILVQNSHSAAFAVFGALVKPHPNTNAKVITDAYIVNAEAVTALDSTTKYRLEQTEEKRQLFTRLRQLDFEVLRGVLESHLLESLAIEVATRGYDDDKIGDSTWWRQAIEDTNQDHGFDHKDFLLVELRNTLEDQGRENLEPLQKHVTRYLNHPRQILRRLGLHLLRTFPLAFLSLVEEVLLEAANYQDGGIHHELFGLLSDGYPHLGEQIQRKVLNIILSGPSQDYLDQSVEWGLSIRESDPNELRQLYLDVWRRDRLWMVRTNLPHKEKLLLEDIITRLKEPEHPSFTSYSTGAGFVASISPVSREGLWQLSPSQLFEYLRNWSPPERENFSFAVENWEGLSGEVSRVLRDDLPRYSSWLLPLFKLRPRLAQAMINITFALDKPPKAQNVPRSGTFQGIRRGKNRRKSIGEPALNTAAKQAQGETQEIPAILPSNITEENALTGEGAETTEVENARSNPVSNQEMWQWRLELAEGILADPLLSVDVTPHFDGGWHSVRRNLVSLLKEGLTAKDERQVPNELLPRVRDALLAFADDPDPDLASDRPQPGWVGHKDPLQVAINHVRTEALSALETYSSIMSTRGLDGHPPLGTGPARLEPQVVAKLTAHLDRTQDPSWAVRSIYGRHLSGLYWLDKSWVEAHLDDIFSWGPDEESRWYFAAAWDSYIVSNNHIFLPLFERMRPIYAQAIEAMEAGFVTQTYLQRTQSFASHLFVEFFSLPYDLRAPAGPDNLLRLFMEKATPEQRGQVAWSLWRTLVAQKEQVENQADDGIESVDFAVQWQKAREFWQWRVDESSQRGHSADFDEEMQWLCLLVNVAPNNETLSSLYPLLLDTLPHLARKEGRLHAWDDLESFVADKVEQDPTTAIRLYSQMHSQMTQAFWVEPESARFILETAAANEEARMQTLDLLDLLARRGVSMFDDILHKWTGSRG